MSVTTVSREAAAPPKKPRRVAAWRCQFCAQGHHRSCPRATRYNGVLWLCHCQEGQDQHHGTYCLSCKHDQTDEINTQEWVCFDMYACAARRQQRNDNNPLWRMIQASKAHGALERKAKRLQQEHLLAEIDPAQEDTIERVQGLLDSINDLVRDVKPRKPRKPSVPKPTSGNCECCGEVTKGGRFLPGHDARLASALVQRALGGDAAALDELVRRNWTKKIPVAQRARLGVAS